MNNTSLFGFILLFLLSIKGNKGTQCRNIKADFVIAIDGTRTIGYEDFDRQIKFLSSVVSNLPIGPDAIRVSIIQFSDGWSTTTELQLGEHKAAKNVVKKLKKMQYSLGYFTLTGRALKMANKQLFGPNSRHGVKKFLLVITDGKPRDVATFNYELRLLKVKGVRVISIATGRSYVEINRHKYVTRTMVTDLANSFKILYKDLPKNINAVTNAICKRQVVPTQAKSKKKECFQEKRDVVFAIDGSRHVSDETFRKALAVILNITNGLDISPSLMHVGLIQFSDRINTRIEFGLNQYTKMYKVKQSLDNIIRANGREADVDLVVNVIDNEIFSNDRLSAEDSLVLLMTEDVKNKKEAEKAIGRLRKKGVHVVVVGLGRKSAEATNFFERLASHPSDVSHIDAVVTRHILGDLASTVCRKVICKEEKKKKPKHCVQKKQDILFMLDASASMKQYFGKCKKFFSKIIKRLNIGVSNIHVGFVQFDQRVTRRNFIRLGQYKFGKRIRDLMLRFRRGYSRRESANIAEAIKHVNRKFFNKLTRRRTSRTSGDRPDAHDLVFIATRGKTLSRRDVQYQIKILKKKGVSVAVLDVGYKKPERQYQNILQDMASGPRNVFPLDFKRISMITQSILDVECDVEEKKVSPSCFQTKREVLFMLDNSQGLTDHQVTNVLNFMANITKILHYIPSNIAIGLLQYSDAYAARLELPLKTRPLEKTLDAIRNLTYRRGKKNELGLALRKVNKLVFPDSRRDDDNEKIILLVTHTEVTNEKRAFTLTQKLKAKGVQLVTVVIRTKKGPSSITNQYKTLSILPTSAHIIDYNNLGEHTKDIMLNLCEFNHCPEDATKRCSAKKQDIFMVIDSSRSIGSDIYKRLVRFVKRFVNKLDVAPDLTHLGIIQASDKDNTEFEMKLNQFSTLKEINNIIQDMGYHHGEVSLIGKAIKTAIKNKLFDKGDDRVDAENILMIFTDGVIHDEPLAKKMVAKLKERGVRIVVVGLGPQSRIPSSKVLLEDMASSKSDVYLVNLNGNVLSGEDEINEVVQHVRTLDCINIYEEPIQCSPENVDIFVMIDGSRSVGIRNFKKIQEFLEKLASEFDIGKNGAHMGLLQYGSIGETRIEFNLSTFGNNEQVNKAIRNLTYLSSYMTETGKALQLVNRLIFSGKNGDRPGVPNILIVFTDGIAHDIDTAYANANELKQRGVRIVGIGAGKQVKNFFHQLQKIASSAEDAHKSDFDKLAGVVEDFLEVVCT